MTEDKYEIDIIANDKFSINFSKLSKDLRHMKVAAGGATASMKTAYTTLENGSSETKKASGALDGLKSSLNGAIGRFFSIQAVIGLASKAFDILVQWIKASIKEFREFEKNMAEVSTILLGDNMKSLTEVRVEIERLSTTYGKSANDIAQAMYDILSATFSASSGLKLLETATKASIAGITSVQSSVDVFTTILNAYGKTAEQAATISDQLFMTVIRGKLRFEDLSSAMGYIVPIAANLNVEFEEIAAALASVTRQGQRVDMASRGLALMLQNISAMSGEAADKAVEYGVDLSDVALSVGGLEYIIKNLNEAMKEHGTQILPEIIRNMRSLRVAMALAGDEGITGFTEDLDYLENATGSTDEALAKMMSTQQQQADMLDQTMAQVNRSVGEAWSGFDLWAKGAQVWWGTLLSGGDPNKTMDKYETSLNDIKIAAMDAVLATQGLEETTPLSDIIKETDLSKIDTFEGKIIHLKEAIEEKYDTSNIKKYIEIAGKIDTLSEEIYDKQIKQIISSGLGAEYENLAIEYGVENIPVEEIARLNQKAWEAGFEGIDFGKLVNKNVSVGGFFDFWGTALTEGWNAAVETTITSQGAKDFEQSYTDFKVEVDELTAKMEVYKNQQARYVDSEMELKNAVDDSIESINTYKENILTLQRAIEDLNEGVTDTYTTIGGKEFGGKDYWELTVAGMETASNRFIRFSQEVIKYGGTMKTDYMDNINGLVNGYDYIDTAQLDVLGSLKWYNEEIFNSIDGIEEFDSDILTVINTISKYTSVVKEVKKIQAEYNTELDESRRKMMELNLQALQIQLRGMLRRRGLTRSEEKQLKMIQIEQTEERIKQMEWELEESNRIRNLNLIEIQDAATRAEDIYNEYVNKVSYAIDDMKDVMDDELKKFLSTINLKEETLIKYGILYTEQIGGLEKAEIDYQALLLTIAGDPILSEYYKKFYGIDALQLAQDELTKLMEYQEQYKVNLGITSSAAETASTVANIGNDIITGVMDSAAETASTVANIGSAIVTGLTGTIADMMASLGGFAGFARGTHSIGREGLYHLHEGETVSPPTADRTGDTGNVTINISVTGNNITKDSEDSIAREIALQVSKKLIDRRTGKSKYRLK